MLTHAVSPDAIALDGATVDPRETPSALAPCPWDETDVPRVAAADLAAAARLWLRRDRSLSNPTVAQPTERLEDIEGDIIAMFEDQPARSLAVLLRVRCLVVALSSRRFAAIAPTHDTDAIADLAAAAADLRLNAGWGFNPVRLAWALKAVQAGDHKNATEAQPATALLAA